MDRARCGFFRAHDPDTITAARAALNQVVAHFFAVLGAAVLFLSVALGREWLHGETIRKVSGTGLEEWHPRRAKKPDSGARTDLLARLSWGLGASLAVALFVVIVVPQATGLLERGFLLPFVLGAWVPVLALVTSYSYQAKVPLLLIGFVFLIVVPALFGDHLPIRLLPPGGGTQPSVLAASRQWQLHTAVGLWAKANDCVLRRPEGSTGQAYAIALPRSPESNDCPSPVIVAAAGGASRAAFITAATLGTLLDATCSKPDSPPGCAESPLFARRLFAISGVSGGSLGAAAYAAALAAARDKGKPHEPPCDRASDHIREFYFRDTAPRTWRDCLEAILSGDFLSATAIGMVMRDPIPIVRRFSGNGIDRAGALEELLSVWFDKATGTKDVFKRPLGSFGPRDGDWRPLLIFNGTSAITGRRVLTSHLFPDHSVEVNDDEKRFRLFQDSYDIWELYQLPFEAEPPRCTKVDEHDKAIAGNPFRDRDFSLATAVTNSARFPVISPAGAISCDRASGGLLADAWNFFTGGGREVVDHVVDGGYFENFGATTAMNLARALATFDLAPVVLVISNNPMAGRAAENMLADACSPLPPDIEDDSWLGKVFRPAGALYQTRDARGSYAVRDLVWSLRTPQTRGIGCKASGEFASGGTFHVTVFGERGASGRAKSVSMSWWLSKTVQQFIDHQIAGYWDGPPGKNESGARCPRRTPRQRPQYRRSVRPHLCRQRVQAILRQGRGASKRDTGALPDQHATGPKSA